MRKPSNLPRIGPLVLAVMLIIAGLIFFFDTALAQYDPPVGPGGECIDFFQPGAGCTANDVRIEAMEIMAVVNGCNADPIGELTADFQILVSAAGSPNRYDIGLFIASDGGSALTGSACYHDFLEAPISPVVSYGDYNSDTYQDIARIYTPGTPHLPWWDGDGDSCGDMAQNTQVFKVYERLTVACNDGDGDGVADIHVCSSWDNNAGTACGGVLDAFPGTKSKCGCQFVPLGFTPTAVSLQTFTASSPDRAALPVIGIAVLILPVIAIWIGRRRLNRTK